MGGNFLTRLGEQAVDLKKYSNKVVHRAVLPRTEAVYQDTLAAYDIWREKHPEASSPPDIQAYKAFLVSVGRAKTGRVYKRPLPDTMDGFRRDFEAGWQRERDYKFPESVTVTIREFIKSGLKEEIGMQEGEMEKHYLSPDDITEALEFLWCKDFIDYKGIHRERSRVDLADSILMYCFTSARTGEVHESTARRAAARCKKDRGAGDMDPAVKAEHGDDQKLSAEALAACYKHFELSIQWVEGEVMLVLMYGREYVKGYWRKKKWELPKHAFYEIYKQKTPLLVSLLVYFLPSASADNAFCDYQSVDELLDEVDRLEKWGGMKSARVVPIRFNKAVMDTPVFRPYNELCISSSTGTGRGADAFGKSFAALSRRMGSLRNFMVRACRRWALNEAGSRYSEVARQKFAGQADRDVFGKYYAHPLSEIDGPATFLGIESREEHIKNLRSMAIYRNADLWQLLPSNKELEFQKRGDILALDTAINELGSKIAMAVGEEQRELHLQQRRLRNRRRQLYTEALRDFQESQPRKFGETTSSRTSPSTSTYFNYIRRVMPERDTLAKILPMKVELRSPQGREALRAMEALCKQDCRIAYRTSLQPIDGKCICKKQIDKYFPHRRWTHLYRCYEEHIRKMGGNDSAELCFECDRWFQGKESWNDHCREHLDNPENLFRYDWIIFRQAPVKAGFCGFCLWDNTLTPARRMRQYIFDEDRSKLRDHYEDHLQRVQGNPTCENPLCKEKFQSTGDLRHHLVDFHCAPLHQEKKRKREVSSTSEEKECLDSDLTKGKRQRALEDLKDPGDIRCPICLKTVSGDLFQQYARGRSYMTCKEERKLCKAHRVKEAQEEWVRCGYPLINWDHLRKRLHNHRSLLRLIIESSSQFFFEKSLEFNIQEIQKTRKDNQGKGGAPRLSDYRTHSYGFYGPKAYHVLGDEIACLAADDLRSAAATKPLIRSCGGVADYIAQVLVPEIITLFVVEDMAVTDVQARTILEDSRELGEILNEE
ncbi:hypothetical protein AJ80_08533 [Polytolypa hystricis UAMH7299]|uniref:C2H2-type domain-containing protein n=1 Tax=Polytolypa hystricis (strain UAMH7299) TaxID=1447883 RepID=A0A2B7X620_POLH7|nr:hypothetical protein AJ80_08533 [Polytolypa hystricis UAMH7299]